MEPEDRMSWMHHSSGESAPRADEIQPRRRSLWASLLICAASASIGFGGRYVFAERHWFVASEIALHVAIGFIVAGTIISLIQFNAEEVARRETRRFRDLVSRDVFQALLGRVMPAAIFSEINDILHGDVARTNCKYLIIFQEPYLGMPNSYFVLRREVTYTVTNLLNRAIDFTARSSHADDLSLTSSVWMGRNFHLKLSVGDEDIPLEMNRNLFVEGNITKLVHKVPLGPRASKRITFHGEEPCRVSAGPNSYFQATPVIGIEILILNQHTERIGAPRVLMNHPGGEGFKPDHSGRYILDRAFLPGQGFLVTWEAISQEAPTA